MGARRRYGLVKKRLESGEKAAQLDAALTLMWVGAERASATVVVLLEGGRVADIIEKPSPEELACYQLTRRADASSSRRTQVLGAASLYALSTRVLGYLPHVPVSRRGEREFPDALRMLIGAGGAIGGLVVRERLTLTRPADLLALNRYFLCHEPACVAVQADLRGDVTVLPPVRIEGGARVGAGCRVGPEVYLEAGCHIGAGAALRGAVVLRGANVEAGAVVEGRVLG